MKVIGQGTLIHLYPHMKDVKPRATHHDKHVKHIDVAGVKITSGAFERNLKFRLIREGHVI